MMSENWTSEITPALKMLKARGGALDLKAVELIEELVEENATLRRFPVRQQDAYDSIRSLISVALQAEGRDDKTNLMSLGDLVQILIAEWRGARHEMDAMQRRRESSLLFDERSSLSDDFARGAQWNSDQIASLEALRQATKAAMIPVLREAGMIDE